MRDEPRDAAVRTLIGRFEEEPTHVQQVARLAVMLFDGLTELHHLESTQRDTLRHAALLHDIGWSVSGSKHHKHSQRLILDHLGEPFTLPERKLIACIARYHRKALPRPKHKLYRDLSPVQQRVCCRLAAFLRIADGLDRSHQALIREVRCEVTSSDVILRLSALREPTLEIGALPKKADLFRQVYQRNLRCETDIIDALQAPQRRTGTS